MASSNVVRCRQTGAGLAARGGTMLRSPLLPLALLALSTSLAACAAPSSDDAEAGDNAITSNDGKILDFTFKCDVDASSETKARQAILSQLAYTQGILTTNERGNGHVGHVVLTDVVETPAAGGKKSITYTAQLPVAWPKTGNAVPPSYDL